jgi:hypothetical protein
MIDTKTQEIWETIEALQGTVAALRQRVKQLEQQHPRTPLRYEYIMLNNPVDRDLNKHAADGYRLKAITVMQDHDGAAEYAYMERPVYEEATP